MQAHNTKLPSMINNLPHLFFSEYQFTYQAIDSIKIPPFPGQLLHGAFGNALHKNVCVIANQNCNQCLLNRNCDYPYLFKHTSNPATIPIASGITQQQNQPPPYIFRYNHQYTQHIAAKHQFDINIILIGQANEKIERIIQSMSTLGKLGISKHKAELVEIRQYNPNTLLPRLISNKPSILDPVEITVPTPPKNIRIHLSTPYISTGKMRGKAFDISHWIIGVIRRIALLQALYGTQNSDYDFKHLKQLSQRIETSHPLLYLYETSHSKHHHATGLLGSIDIQLSGYEEIWPWLYLGQWIHGGKKTSNGYGRYELLSL